MSLFKRSSPFIIVALLLTALCLIVFLGKDDASHPNSVDAPTAGPSSVADAPESALEEVPEQKIDEPAQETTHAVEPVRPSPNDLDALKRQQLSQIHYFKSLFPNGEPFFVPRSIFNVLSGSQMGQEVEIEVGPLTFTGIVSSVRENNGGGSYGIDLHGDVGRLVMHTDIHGGIKAYVGLNGNSRLIRITSYHEVEGHDGLIVKQGNVGGSFCAPPDAVYPFSHPANRGKLGGMLASPSASTTSTAPSVTTALPLLQSSEGSEYVLYCDFDGEVVENDPDWNDLSLPIINAQPHPRYEDEVFVTKVMERVFEDFAPFDLNVTTDRAVYDLADIDKRLHVIITPTNNVAPGAGGIAPDFDLTGGNFRRAGSSPITWVFNLDEAVCAATISHESGHVFGLFHDSLMNDNYYGGHDTSYPPGWAPIMGAPWADGRDGAEFLNKYDEVDQWSNGEYSPSSMHLVNDQDGDGIPDYITNFQDDIAIIGSEFHGFGFRADDYDDTFDAPAVGNFIVIEENLIQASGLISTTIKLPIHGSGGATPLRRYLSRR